MKFLSDFWALLHTPMGAAILASMLAISEALGTMDKFKESSILAYVVKALKAVKEKLAPAKID